MILGSLWYLKLNTIDYWFEMNDIRGKSTNHKSCFVLVNVLFINININVIYISFFNKFILRKSYNIFLCALQTRLFEFLINFIATLYQRWNWMRWNEWLKFSFVLPSFSCNFWYRLLCWMRSKAYLYNFLRKIIVHWINFATAKDLKISTFLYVCNFLFTLIIAGISFYAIGRFWNIKMGVCFGFDFFKMIIAEYPGSHSPFDYGWFEFWKRKMKFLKICWYA